MNHIKHSYKIKNKFHKNQYGLLNQANAQIEEKESQ